MCDDASSRGVGRSDDGLAEEIRKVEGSEMNFEELVGKDFTFRELYQL